MFAQDGVLNETEMNSVHHRAVILRSVTPIFVFSSVGVA